MNRRQFLTTSAAATAGLLIDLAVQVAAAQSAQPAPFALDSPPVLQNPTADGVTVAWAVNGPATGWVEWGNTDRLGKRSATTTSGLLPYEPRFLSARITGLEPGRPIHYRVVSAPIGFHGPYKIERGEPVFGEIHRYTPPSPESQTATFAVINDTHEKVPTLAALTGALASDPADFTIWNGDVFDDVNADDQVVANVLRPAGAAYAAEKPVLFVPGNHDHRGVAARGLSRAFILWPDEPELPRCWAVRHGPLAMIGLDTGEDKPDRHKAWAGLAAFEPYRQKQRDWLAGALLRPEIAGAPFLVVFCHIPLWGLPGENGGDTLQGYGSWQKHARDLWHPVLAESGAQLIICGHTHKHRYDAAAEDRPYAQLIGGGPQLETATLIRGRATPRELEVTCTKVAGEALGSWKFAAR
jgi:predicted phosphodiesterase